METLNKEQEWISVKDRLPLIKGIQYLIFHEGFMITAYFHIDPNDNMPWWESDITITNGVTHWQPLPNKPKGV